MHIKNKLRRAFLKAHRHDWLYTEGVERYATRKRNHDMRRRLYDGNRTMPCHYCGRMLRFHQSSLDHKRPVSKGGRTTKANCVVACVPCNTAKGSMNYGDYMALIQGESK